MEDNITFAFYNDPTIDNLQYFEWTVDLGGTADSISIPISHAKGRMWFTVYDSSV